MKDLLQKETGVDFFCEGGGGGGGGGLFLEIVV